MDSPNIGVKHFLSLKKWGGGVILIMFAQYLYH